MKFFWILIFICKILISLAENKSAIINHVKTPIISRSRRAVIYAYAKRWPNAVIPYRIDLKNFGNHEIHSLKDAMKAWNEETCVRFRPRRIPDRNGIKITTGNRCYSLMGIDKNRYEQDVNLSPKGCRYYGLYLHELGHAIGLHHEQIRPDRDTMVKVNFRYMPRYWKILYTKWPANLLRSFDTPYDFQSIMQYGPNNARFIETKNSSFNHLLRETYTNRLSFFDAKVVNLFYRCANRCKNRFKIKCSPPGFIDQNCQCQTPQTFYKRRCVNKLSDVLCERMVSKGDCKNPARINRMIVDCQKACDLCYQPDNWHIKKLPKCQNSRGDAACHRFRNHNQCKVNPHYMFLKCTKACGVCDPSKTSRTDSCRDLFNSISCKIWVIEGECEKNTAWMSESCSRSCGICGPGKFYLPKFTKTPIKTQTIYPQLSAKNCRDVAKSNECKKWAKADQCEKNPTYMKVFCKESCGICEQMRTSDTRGKCADKYDSVMCEYWVNNGQCRINQVWMNDNCKKSCKFCILNSSKKNVRDKNYSTKFSSKTTKISKNISKKTETHNFSTKQTRVTHQEISANNADIKNSSKSTQKKVAKHGWRRLKMDCINLAGDKDCELWRKHRYCKSNSIYMNVRCQKSCGTCRRCIDRREINYCDHWRRKAQCRTNTLFMAKYCPVTCRYCQQNETVHYILYPSNGFYVTSKKHEIQSRTSTSYVNITIMPLSSSNLSYISDGKANSTCRNLARYLKCVVWRTLGQCRINNNVQKMCELTCQQCNNNDTQSNTTSTHEISNFQKKCVDILSVCLLWKMNGFCDIGLQKFKITRSFSYIQLNCAATCGLCGKLREINAILTRTSILLNKNLKNKGVLPVEIKIKNETTPKYSSTTASFMRFLTADRHLSTLNSIDYSFIANRTLTNNTYDALSNTTESNVTNTNSTSITSNITMKSSMSQPIEDKRAKNCENVFQNAEKCVGWAAKGRCKSQLWMRLNCAQACGTCSLIEDPCYDRLPQRECSVWTWLGECELRERMMVSDCPKTCGHCQPESTGPESKKMNGAKSTPVNSIQCFDLKKKVECQRWKQIGHCKINPRFMKLHCAETCGHCIGKSYREKIQVKCEDTYSSCGLLKLAKYCQSFMIINMCRKTCNRCI